MNRFGYFTPASSSDFVANFFRGTLKASGKGLPFVVTPWTSIAVVSQAQQNISFMFSEQTADSQAVVVKGSLQASYIPTTLIARYDFAVNTKTGGYLKPGNLETLRAEVQNVLQAAVREKVGAKGLDDHMKARTELANEVISAAKAKSAELAQLGVQIVDAFVTGIEPENKDLQKAYEAEKRENVLAKADKALANRRMEAAKNQREQRKYEAETEKLMEKERTDLIEVKNANTISEAQAEATAAEKKLEPFKSMDPGVLMAMALREFAEKGNVENLNLSPELFTAMRSLHVMNGKG